MDRAIKPQRGDTKAQALPVRLRGADAAPDGAKPGFTILNYKDDAPDGWAFGSSCPSVTATTDRAVQKFTCARVHCIAESKLDRRLRPEYTALREKR